MCDVRNKEGKRISSIVVDQSVELGHLFVLGDHYSKQLGLQYKNDPVQMGYLFIPFIMHSCYGLGLSRMLGTLFQVYGYKNGVIFPDKITTYDVVIVHAGMYCSYVLSI